MSAQVYSFTHEVLSLREGLRYFALSLTRNEEESDDLLQETMLKAFTYKDKFRADTNLKAWLYTIMKNIFINNYRKNVKKRHIIDNSRDSYYINIPQSAGAVEPERLLFRAEIARRVDALDASYQVPFRMYFEGFKYKEIAGELGLPIGTVKSRIFLARKMLMAELQEFVH